VIEVYPLKEVLKQKGLNFIRSDRPKYEKRVIWNELSFFIELRKKVGKEGFSRVSEIYTSCLSRPEFEVVFGEGAKIATFNILLKKWQDQKIGMPQPIQVYANGRLAMDYRKLPENLEIELRKMTGEPRWKTGKPKDWCYFDLRNQISFNMITKTLAWLSE
jgi:hypothetical protein